MGPKKKGKQNKLARMSDDERLRYLQHKAAQEEEARRRKQQLIATFLKNKIKQEENFARLNQAKIDEQWRHLLRKAKCKELKLELETSRQQFEHLLTRRNQVINSLQEDLHESECQYLVILQAHMEAVDKILSMGTNRVTQQAERYVRQKSYMLEMAKQEAEFESSRNRRAQKLLLTVLFAIREAAAVLQNQMKSKALTKRTEIRNSYSEEMQALQLRLGGHLDNLQEQLQNVFRSYTTSTQELRRMYEEMKDRDEENLEIIAKHEEVIAKLLAEEEKLQNQLDTFQKGTTPRSTKLQAQERQLSAECWRVRKQQQNKLRIDELKIKNITLASSKCIEKLEKVKQKGENLLKIAQLCSKLETEEEKVILNYAAPEQASSAETTESSEIQDPTEIPHGMENFWRRHSQALLSRAALRMHYDTLMQENQQLRSAVRQYLATAASSSMTPSSAPLLLARKLRGRKISLITMPNSRPPKPPACIEAAIAVKTMLK